MRSQLTSVSLSALLIAVLLGSAASPAHAQLGVAAGLNFESAGDIELSTENNGTLENSSGYHLGIVYDMNLGAASLRPGLFYRRVGEYEFSQDALPGGEDAFDIAAWEVPLDLRFTVLPTPLVSPYLLGGAMATFPRGENDFDDALRDVSYSFNVGVGVDLSLGSSLTLQPEFRYEFGATSFVEDEFEIGDIEFTPQESPRFSAFSLRLNVLF